MTDQAIIDNLLPQCSETERAELSTKYNAYVRWLKAYQADQARTVLSELDAAKKSLTQLIDEIQGRSDARAADPEPLPNLMAAAVYLQAEGWKIGKSKLYDDAKAGKIRVNSDSTVNESEAIAYAAKHLKKKLNGEAPAIDNLLREEKEAQVALLKTREEKLRFEKEREQGRYLLRDDVVLETCFKIGVLEAGLKNTVRNRAEEWLHQVGGDATRSELFRELVYREIDRLLDEFGNMDQINITIRKQQPEEKSP